MKEQGSRPRRLDALNLNTTPTRFHPTAERTRADPRHWPKLNGVTPPHLSLDQGGQQANRRAPQPGYKKRCDLMQGVGALALAEPSGPNLSLPVAAKTSPP